MIAVDTNILVYAHREDSPWQDSAYASVVELAEGSSLWAIPWPCVHEFLAIVTHPRIYSPPTSLAAAIDQIEAWLESPRLILLKETEGCWPQCRNIIETGRIVGGQIHDARIGVSIQINYQNFLVWILLFVGMIRSINFTSG